MDYLEYSDAAGSPHFAQESKNSDSKGFEHAASSARVYNGASDESKGDYDLSYGAVKRSRAGGDTRGQVSIVADCVKAGAVGSAKLPIATTAGMLYASACTRKQLNH